MEDFVLITNRIVAYIKNPTCKSYDDLSSKAKVKLMLVILALSFALNFFFIIIIGLLEQSGLFNLEDHAVNQLFEDFSPWLVILLAVIIAPVFEELIFRAPITLFCKYTGAFKYVFYGFALAFGFIHITNYELTSNVLLLSPILVAPQIILGLFLGMIRVRLGLLYCMAFHAFYNAILVIPGILFYTP